jgi:hypothetical protein
MRLVEALDDTRISLLPSSLILAEGLQEFEGFGHDDFMARLFWETLKSSLVLTD